MAKKITIDLEAGTASFINNVESAGHTLEGFGKSANEARGFLDYFQEGLGIGTGFEVAEKGLDLVREGLDKVKEGFEQVGEIGRGATRLGISTEDFSRLKYAAEVSHVSMEQVEGDAGKMLAALSKAADGDKQLSATFEKLHLDVNELKEAQPAEAFEKIGEAISGMANRADRMEAVREIFGRAGTAILPMIENLRQLEQESDQVGFTRTAEDVRQVEEAEKEWARTTKQVEAAFMDLGVTASGALTKIAHGAGESAGVLRSLLDQFGSGANYRFESFNKSGEQEVQEAIGARNAANQAMHAGDDVKAYEQQKIYVEQLKNAIRDLSAAETEAANAGKSDVAAGIGKEIQDLMDGMKVADPVLEALKKRFDAIKEAEKGAAEGAAEAKREAEEWIKDFTEGQKEMAQAAKEAEQEAKEAARSQDERLKRELEHYRQLTEDPALKKYQDTLQELDDLKAHSKITDDQYASALSKAQHDLAGTVEKRNEGLAREMDHKADLETRRFTFDLPKDPHAADALTIQKQQYAMQQNWDQYFRQIWQQLTQPNTGQDVVAAIA